MRLPKRLSTRIGLAVGVLLVSMLVVHFAITHAVMRRQLQELRHSGARVGLELFGRTLEQGVPAGEGFDERWPEGPKFAAYDGQGRALVGMPGTPYVPASMHGESAAR